MSANTSVDTPPTHYRHVGRHTTDAFIEKLTFPNSYFVTSFSRKQEERHKKDGRLSADCRPTVGRLSADASMGSDSLPLPKKGEGRNQAKK